MTTLDEETLIKPEHELALIHKGYDPSKANIKGLADDNAFVKEHFGKVESPLLLLNFGGSLDISTGQSMLEDSWHFGVRTTLPTFGIYTVQGRHEPVWGFSTVNTGENTESAYSFSTKNTTISTRKTERLHILHMFLRGDTNYNVTIWPYGSEDLMPSTVAVPFLPVIERDAMFWNKLAEVHGLALDDAVEEAWGLVSYEAIIENDNVESLRFSSTPKYSASDLIIDVTFKESVSGDGFRPFQGSVFRRSKVLLDDDYVVSDGLTGTKLHAEIPKGINYLASGLVKYISDMK